MTCWSILVHTIRPGGDCPGAVSCDGAGSAPIPHPARQTPGRTQRSRTVALRPRQPVPVAGFDSITYHLRRHGALRTAGTLAGRPRRSASAFPNLTTADAVLGIRSCGGPQLLQRRTMCLHRYWTSRLSASSVHCSPADSGSDCSGQSLNHSRRPPCDLSRRLVAIHHANLLATFAVLRHLILLDGVSRFPRRRTARPRSPVAHTPLRASPCAKPILRDRPAATPPRRARDPCFVAHRVHFLRLPCGVAVCASANSTCCPDSVAQWPTQTSMSARSVARIQPAVCDTSCNTPSRRSIITLFPHPIPRPRIRLTFGLECTAETARPSMSRHQTVQGEYASYTVCARHWMPRVGV